jgi:hypothetical protein
LTQAFYVTPKFVYLLAVHEITYDIIAASSIWRILVQ